MDENRTFEYKWVVRIRFFFFFLINIIEIFEFKKITNTDGNKIFRFFLSFVREIVLLF